METAKINKKRVSEVRVAIMGDPVIDVSRRPQLSVDKQEDLLDRLTMVRAGLFDKNSAKDARHWNYLLQGEGGSKQSIIWLTIFGSIFVATLLSLIR
jgi:hypothetical protein